jgi:hypothetical protein
MPRETRRSEASLKKLDHKEHKEDTQKIMEKIVSAPMSLP